MLSLLSLLECTLLSPGFLKKQVDKSSYTAHGIEDMEDIFVSYGISSDFDEAFFTSVPVSYTHLDVYKRQGWPPSAVRLLA